MKKGRSLSQRCYLLIAFTVAISSQVGFCQGNKTKIAIGRLSPHDPNSFSRPDEVKVTHMDLELDISFEKKTLSGSVTLTVERVNNDAKILILDTRDLKITQVQDFSPKESLEFKIGETISTFGEKLEITLPDNKNQLKIIVHYSTTPKSTALQWLNPEQTTGKKHPFLFSQCEAINCRSLVPCQDSPSNRVTYSAKITAPKELTVLMSAVRQGELDYKEEKKVYFFRQSVSIPIYLLAIVVGDLKGRQIGPRSHVWAEPDLLDKAAYEFAETEAQLAAAEDICGPYVWGVYDLLVLPPSFPYGGMENPCLTYVSPSLIAGDRSLVSTVAHEIAHSWTGNLVTNANFEHFWLNEGFTVFVERKIIGRLHGEKRRQFASIGGRTVLQDAIKSMGEKDPMTSLVPDLTGIDPEDSFSRVPYEKGSALLSYLEELLGGPEKFEPFLRSYIANFKHRSLVTSEFVDYLQHYFSNTSRSVAKELDEVDWDSWFYKPGMPPAFANYDDSLAKACLELSEKWSNWSAKGCPDPVPFSSEDLASFSSAQVQEFLSQLVLSEPLTEKAVKTMQELYKLDAVMNSEVRLRWVRLCIRAQYEDVIPNAIEFATSTGRMKYCRPVFKELYNWEYSRPMAIEAYNKVKDSWMHVTANTIGKDLHLVE